MPDELVIDPPAPAVQARADVNAATRSLAASLHLATAWANTQIDNNADLPTVRLAALSEIERRSAAGTVRVQQIGESHDDPGVIRTRQSEAFAHRMNPSLALPDHARQYAAMGYADHARAMLSMRGEPGIAYMSKETVITRAIASGDLPELLQATGNRVLQASYEAAPNPLKTLARQVTSADFRTRTVIRLGEMSILSRVAEGGEVTSGGVGESDESYALATYAKIFSLTRQAMINDDLGAFSGITGAMGRAAAETEAGLLVSLLVQNNGTGPEMHDGANLFNITHGNIAAVPSIVDVADLDIARQAMRFQKGVDGVTPINATPKFLLVSPVKETQAEQVLTAIYAQTPANVNPFVGRIAGVLVEPRLAGHAWYVFADPATLPVLEYAYLSAAPGPQMVARQGWDVLGMEFRVHLDFGCGAIDWRGAFYNAGA